MSQHTMMVPEGSGVAVRSGFDAAIQALASNSGGPSDPPTAYPCMWWADNSNGLLKQRNVANTAWITIGKLDTANLGLLPLAGGNLSGAVNEALGTAVASAAAPDIWSGAGTGNNSGASLHITGTTAITGFAAAPQAGACRRIIFDAALTLTNGANLILPSNANITTVAGDSCEVLAETTTKFRVLSYSRSDGTSITTAHAGVVPVSSSMILAASQIGSFVEMTGAGGYTVTLPTSTGNGGGKFTFYNNCSTACTISAASGQNINNGTSNLASITIPPGGSFDLATDGASWTIVQGTGFGVLQTWQTASLSMGTTYFNTTGAPIEVDAYFSVNGSSSGYWVSNGATRGYFVSNTSASALGISKNITVQPGCSFSFGTQSGTIGIVNASMLK